jgi:transcriptional regulator of acetoin/glycerol metabolism
MLLSNEDDKRAADLNRPSPLPAQARAIFPIRVVATPQSQKLGFILIDRRNDLTKLESSYRRLVRAHLPVNLYSAQAQVQRRAASLLHGMDEMSGLWEELDGLHLADDERGDRTSFLLGGTAGGVALPPMPRCGLFAAAGAGTIFLKNIEKLSVAAQHVLCRIIETGHYTPVGDPYPRTVNCRIIVGTTRPLMELARGLLVEWRLAEMLGHIAMRAEDVIDALDVEGFFSTHPGTLAAAS